MEQRITLITLGVEDLALSLAFYEEVLGWTRSSASQESVAFFQLGGVILSLFSRSALAEDANVANDGIGFDGVTLSLNMRSEEEVDQTLDEIASKGGEVVKPPEKVFWGGYSGYFRDPDGHLFEIAHNPFWELDEDGHVILPN